MFVGQNTCVGGFGVLLVCPFYTRLSHAMDIVGRHMCNVTYVNLDNGMSGL